MSQENVEVVRRYVLAWNMGDMDEILALFHLDIEWRSSGAFPGLDSAYSGHDGFRKFWRDFSAAWDSILISAQELRDCGECVLALAMFEARGRDGVDVQRRTAGVITIRDGLIARIENYSDWAEALEAVGLSE